jgi:hypothetical protein
MFLSRIMGKCELIGKNRSQQEKAPRLPVCSKEAATCLHPYRDLTRYETRGVIVMIFLPIRIADESGIF